MGEVREAEVSERASLVVGHGSLWALILFFAIAIIFVAFIVWVDDE